MTTGEIWTAKINPDRRGPAPSPATLDALADGVRAWRGPRVLPGMHVIPDVFAARLHGEPYPDEIWTKPGSRIRWREHVTQDLSAIVRLADDVSAWAGECIDRPVVVEILWNDGDKRRVLRTVKGNDDA
jgi:hypothetical protein